MGDSDKRRRQITRPNRWLRVMRTGTDGIERLVLVSYVARAVPDGKGNLKVKMNSPEALLLEHPLGFEPPMIERAASAAAFEFHWKLFDYVFALPDPRTFPELLVRLPPADQEIVDRYIKTASDLAASSVVNAVDAGMVVDIEDHTDIERIDLREPARDTQMGFAALLRHCDSPNETAPFSRVANILWQTADRAGSGSNDDERHMLLRAWRKALGRSHERSLNQLVRDKLAAEEGLTVLSFEEEHSPAKLLSLYDYGDLLHWDRGREVLAGWQDDEFRAGERRHEFLAAATAIAHLHIGFAVLAAAATGSAQASD